MARPSESPTGPAPGDRSPGATLAAVAVVPARIGSVRLPRKMLLRETGRFLFEHTVRNVERADFIRSVWLATDSDEVVRAAAEVGVRALLTSASHPSGTDRVREAVALLRASDGLAPDVVINVQGDEPEIAPADLDRLVAAFQDPAVEIATLWAPIESDAEHASPNIVKLVCDDAGRALYFSRAPIPAAAAHGEPACAPRRHVGVYAFRPDALERFCALPPSPLERTERLEQLRWLESGGRVHALRAEHAPPGIDTRDDYRAFVRRCEQRQDPSHPDPARTA